MRNLYGSFILGFGFLAIAGSANAQLVASWSFNGNLNNNVNGGSALTAVNPLSENSYSSTTLYGAQHEVYNMVGGQGFTSNAGLQVANNFLATGSSYSLEILFSQTNSPNTNGYRKIFDNSNRAADQGLYIDPSNQMYYYSDGGSPQASIAANTFYDVMLTYNGTTGAGNIYVNGALDSSFTGSDPAINSSNPLSFFMDDSATSGREFSDASVGLINVWSSVLSANQVATIDSNPYQAVPEPASMTALGLGIAALISRRRKR